MPKKAYRLHVCDERLFRRPSARSSRPATRRCFVIILDCINQDIQLYYKARLPSFRPGEDPGQFGLLDLQSRSPERIPAGRGRIEGYRHPTDPPRITKRWIKNHTKHTPRPVPVALLFDRRVRRSLKIHRLDHRSTSPNTKSMVPMMATASGKKLREKS